MASIKYLDLSEFNPDCYINPDSLDHEIVDILASIFVLKSLKNYCEIKKQAMRCRLKGNIEMAKILESDCQKIYNSLPKDIVW